MRIGGSVALVTGASRGIGRATGIALAAAGAKVALTARDGVELERTAALIRDRGGDAVVLPADVTSRAEVDGVVSAVRSHWSDADIVVANAGVYVRRPVVELTVADLEAALAANLYGAVNVALAVLPELTARGRGHIVLVNSVDGRKGLPGDAPYVSAKFALTGLAQVLRQELRAYGIGVSSIFPGRVDTEMIAGMRLPRFPRILRAEEVADAIVGAIRHNRREVVLPRLAAGLLWADLLSPRLGDWLVRRLQLSGK